MPFGAGIVRRVLARRYRTWATTARFVHADSPVAFDIRAIDLTRGVGTGSDMLETATVAPAASIKAADLCALGLEPQELVGGTVTLNGVDWKINRHEPKPGPFGADSGEVYFMLVKPDDD